MRDVQKTFAGRDDGAAMIDSEHLARRAGERKADALRGPDREPATCKRREGARVGMRQRANPAAEGAGVAAPINDAVLRSAARPNGGGAFVLLDARRAAAGEKRQGLGEKRGCN